MGTTEEAARAMVGTLAHRLAVPEPHVVVRRRGRACRVRLTTEPATLEIPRRTLRRYDPIATRGVLAHELSHVKWDRGTRQLLSRRAIAGIVAATLLAWLAATVPFTLLFRVGGALSPGEALSLGQFAALIVAFLVLRGLAVRATKDHMRLTELRADLTAVQLVGLAPVEAFLSRHTGPLLLLDTWLQGTHPSTRARLAAVRRYDGHSDPDTTARLIWRAGDTGSRDTL